MRALRQHRLCFDLSSCHKKQVSLLRIGGIAFRVDQPGAGIEIKVQTVLDPSGEAVNEDWLSGESLSLEDSRQLPRGFDRINSRHDSFSDQEHCQKNTSQMNSKQSDRFPAPDDQDPANPHGEEK